MTVDIHGHFERALRKIPAIAVGTVREGDRAVVGLGTVEAEPHPAQLAWEIGSITKVFTGLLLAEMSIRGEVGLEDPIGAHLPSAVLPGFHLLIVSRRWRSWLPTRLVSRGFPGRGTRS